MAAATVAKAACEAVLQPDEAGRGNEEDAQEADAGDRGEAGQVTDAALAVYPDEAGRQEATESGQPVVAPPAMVPVQDESLSATVTDYPAHGEEVVDASIRYDWMSNDSEVYLVNK